ncbi:MAG: hypothetical protein FWD75_05005 [Propionibacteriaceae bacterium]|nr:hypothetical protein [Propionibacteriaceae bacterium]
MTTHIRSIVAALMLVSSSMLAFTGCTASREPTEPITPPDPPSQSFSTTEKIGTFGTYSDFRDIYTRTTVELSDSLPPGYRFPSEPAGDWDRDGSFESGVGEMQAAFYWQCAWEKAYTRAAASHDTATMTEALDQLVAWTHLPMVTAHIDEDSLQRWTAKLITPARMGDDTALVNYSTTCNATEQPVS